MSLYNDNKAAISIAHNAIQHDRTVEVDQHFIKVHLKSKNIYILFVKIDDQQAKILTKGLTSVQFSSIVGKLEMWDLYSPA